MKQRDRFLFVLGPHRSGTSLVASALHSLGVDLGSQFIDPNDDNPKGFFEDEEIVRFNDRLLRSMSLSWDSFGFIWEEDFSAKQFRPYHNAAVTMIRDRFSNSSVSGLKDPRFCILLPFWKNVVSDALDVEVSYVLGIRSPDQCVRSQRSRHIKDSDFHLLGRRNVQTLLMWWTYLRKALKEVDSRHLLIVDYMSLVAAPEVELQRLARLLELDLSPDVAQSFSRHHVDPLLNRSQSPVKEEQRRSPLLWRYSQTLYERLLLLSRNDYIQPEELQGVLQHIDVPQLESLYLQELQYLYGYSYKKIISLRHRLIRAIQEIGSEREKSSHLQEQCDILQAQHESLVDQHESLVEQYQSLAREHEVLSENHQIVINTKGWRLLVFARRCVTWPFSR